MDDIYDNLENFTEESTIAELREENNNLKFKLDEYASALDKLQKVFDTLSSEHKKLELNYSSLLKTARSEIERKTQIITKLNIEKDAMVLNAIQNRNIPYNRRKVTKEKPIDQKQESVCVNSTTHISNANSVKPNIPNPGTNERRKDNCSSSANTTALSNIQTKHLDIVNNTVGNPNQKTVKNNEAKENVNNKDDGQRSRAQITGRRKSMPAFSADSAKFSTDEDEVASTESLKESTIKDQSVKYADNFHNYKTNVEENNLGHKECVKEARSRYSKHDSVKQRIRENQEQFQRFRRYNSPNRNGNRSLDRRKFSPEKRRGSPDRNKREMRDHSEEFYRRQEYDRRKRLVSPLGPERRRGSSDRYKKESRDHSEEFYKRQEYERSKRLVSPPRDKYYNEYKSRSRDSQRSNDRSHVQDFDRYKPHGQDMHKMKRKLHDFEEQCVKRSRHDSHHRHEERRDERQAGSIIEVEDLHNMSCQSPDQTHLEAPPLHQATEIKLNSSTKLDDPRLLSKKYTLKTHDGILELSTVESANIEVKVIDTSKWDMVETIKIPDALLNKPTISDTLNVSLLQKPMTFNRPDTLPQITMSDVPDASVQRLTSANTPDVFIQNALSTDVPETNETSHQKAMITHILDNLTQKQKTTDEIMPDASTQIPMSTDELVKEIYMDIENPISDTSAESDDLYGSNLQSCGGTNITHKISKQHMVEPQKTEKHSQKLGNYKIPKRSNDNTENAKISNNLLSLDKFNYTNKTSDNIKDFNKSTDETREVPRLNEHKKTRRRNSDFQCDHQNLITAKNIIEGDLELSDENSDNTDVQLVKQITVLDKRVVDTKDVSLCSNKTHDLKTSNPKTDFNETNTQKVEQSSEEKETTIMETKKCKSRKKSFKLKDTKEFNEQKDNEVSVVNIREDNIKSEDTSLSLDQLVKIKESIKHELFKDEITCKDKPVKKTENKSRVLSKYKETALVVDKPVKKKENQVKELSETKGCASKVMPSAENPVKQKENKSEEPHEKKESLDMDKPVRKKGSKTKESQEHKKASVDKSAKKKQNKAKEHEITDYTTTVIERQIKSKVSKPKETKFSELFGDSSSLVSPEDLGLIPRVVAPSETYVTMFEDAQDAIDMNTIRPADASSTMEISNDIIDKTDTKTNFNMNDQIKNTPAITVEPTYPNIREAAQTETVPAESTIIRNMYQNLQPEISPKDHDILKTIIISSGTQPQCVLEPIETQSIIKDGTADADLHIMQCVKPTVLQDIAMQALATSTPQKIWQQNVVQTNIDPKISKCSNESRDVSVDKTLQIANSDMTTNSTITNDTDEPDVTIFVKRRRKVIRKK